MTLGWSFSSLTRQPMLQVTNSLGILEVICHLISLSSMNIILVRIVQSSLPRNTFFKCCFRFSMVDVILVSSFLMASPSSLIYRLEKLFRNIFW